MEALTAVSTLAPPSLFKSHLFKPTSTLSFTHKTPNLRQFSRYKSTTFNVVSPSVSTEPVAAQPVKDIEIVDEDEKFDWFSNWYAVMPVDDLDKRVPVGKKVLGLDVVVWWDKNDNEWKVFEDRCPHRLAPLSEGRIDQLGRLQCVYHGWCFGGSGDCKLIPQAPLDGPPVHSSKRACVGVYPSTVQNGFVWFWPNTDPKYKDILAKKKPPYVPELDDPAYGFKTFNRDIPYGYEVLIENLMDPAHVPYAHLGLMEPVNPTSVKRDREGGFPMDIKMERSDKNGFTSTRPPYQKWDFVSPCLYQITVTKESVDQLPEIIVFFCIPVSPGNSRLLMATPRHFWSKIFTFRWLDHVLHNLVLDSDLYLLRVEEEKLIEAGNSNWQKACFVPAKADANVLAYRMWLKKYAGGQFDWGTKFNGSLPPTPPRLQLMDRYWSHVVNCSSCTDAYKGFNALKISLQVFSVALVAIMAATKPGMISIFARNTLAAAAIMCFVGSKWLSHSIYKNFHFHDYLHAFK